MKRYILIITLLALVAACNTKQPISEPTSDNKANPAEMPVDSVGVDADMQDNSAADSNRTGDDNMRSPGVSDNDKGSGNTDGKTTTSSGQTIDVPASESNNKK